MKFVLEVIGFTLPGCVAAQNAGAKRIELCDNPGEGGTTPSLGFIQQARKILKIDLYPIIRPRGGDFLYSDAEFDAMMTDIIACKNAGCNGVVTGILTEAGTVDKERNKKLVALAYPMGVTFHRAFDRTADLSQALEDVIDCGFERILTSGGMPQAADAAGILAALIKQANDRIIIMPGSGVHSANIAALAKDTGAVEFHSSARRIEPSQMRYVKEDMQENLTSFSVAEYEVGQMVEILSAL